MFASLLNHERRLLAPEVVQASAMDCGPATLKCMLEGFGISVSYGRLREACQTDVDGTSIDTVEEAIVQLGLDAEQIMLPADHVLLPEANALPSVVVTRRPNEATHFVVAWRRVGPVVQIMDPATGRLWMTHQQLLDDLYIHTFPVPAPAWRDWAGSEEFLEPLRRRLRNLGLSESQAAEFIAPACTDSSWRSLGTLDAATRMVTSIVRADGLRPGDEARRALAHFVTTAEGEGTDSVETIPARYWSVQPADAAQHLNLRGAVLVRVQGRRPRRPADGPSAQSVSEDRISPELEAALTEEAHHPMVELLHYLRKDGFLAPTVVVAALIFAAGGVVIEALLFRGLLDIAFELSLPQQRIATVLAIVAFVLFLLLLEWPTFSNVMRLGRHLEIRMRLAFLEKIPRLHDRYFRSRLISDMAERIHSIHQIRLLPYGGARFIQYTAELLLTTAGIIWLDVSVAPIAMLAALVALGLPLALEPALSEREMRVRTHLGALSRFYLDAVLGLVAVRSHGAESAVRREHESLVVEWARARLGLMRTVVSLEGLQLLLGFGFAAWLLWAHLVSAAGDLAGTLLLVYWALNLPVLGREVATLAKKYPTYRNVSVRLLEPLGALEDIGVQHEAQPVPAAETDTAGVAIRMQNVQVRAAGHTILDDITVEVPSETHIGIVGPSGAGKSSLVGLLLGWHRPAAGHITVDGDPLDGERVRRLRRQTAWVDPAVQLWNQSLLENLTYGSNNGIDAPIGVVIEQAELLDVLKKLPDGLQTDLGEGGGLVSGGEGQRVRLGRALLRPNVRLVILDEPFRGLDRSTRQTLLARAREVWDGCTLLYVTHDVSATTALDHIVVLEEGQIVEQGHPSALRQDDSSAYCSMLAAEAAVREEMWSHVDWRRLWLADGRLTERDTDEGVTGD